MFKYVDVSGNVGTMSKSDIVSYKPGTTVGTTVVLTRKGTVTIPFFCDAFRILLNSI